MGFLSGDPVGTVPTQSSQQTTMPDWYTNYAMDILSNQNAIANRPYTPYEGPSVAGLTPDQQRAAELARQVARPEGLQQAEGALAGVAGGSALTSAKPYFDQAGAMSGVGAADPSLRTGAGYLASSTNPTGIDMASPFLTKAGQTSVQGIEGYMNPYTDMVVNRIGDLGARSLREKLLPQITDQFVGAGGYGGSRQAEAIGRAVRDTQEGISAEQARALEAGYGGALQTSSADLARQAQLAGTAGQLGTAQQEALRAAGTGMAGIGQTYGALTADQQRILSGIGTSTGALAAGDLDRQMSAAREMAAISKQRQEMGIAGAGALNAFGEQQRGVDQASLDAARKEFDLQQAYPQLQNAGLVGALQGVSGAVPRYTEGAGTEQATAFKPSTASTIGSIASTALGLLGNIGGSGSGGGGNTVKGALGTQYDV
jgi:hypothetical protein